MIEFRESDHTYWKDGKRVPNVTSILSPIGCLDGIPEYIINRKSAIGSASHLATEYADKDILDWDSVDPIIRPYVDGWLKFRRDTGFFPDVIEKRVYHPAWNYAGTLDRTGYMGSGEFVLLDIKTTATMYPSVGPQLAGYDEAFVAEGGERPEKRLAIQLTKTGGYKMHEYKERSDKSVFFSLLTVHNFKIKHGLEK